MATLKDAIALYGENQAKRLNEQEAEQAKKIAETESEVKKAFEEIGLTPDRVAGQSAFFQFEDKEVQFVVVQWKYRNSAFYRVLGECSRCHNNTFTDEFSLTLENVGWMLSEPQKRYHECWIEDAGVQLKAVEKTRAERLVDLIDDLIEEKMAALNS